jgi:hypothetical protein
VLTDFLCVMPAEKRGMIKVKVGIALRCRLNQRFACIV